MRVNRKENRSIWEKKGEMRETEKNIKQNERIYK